MLPQQRLVGVTGALAAAVRVVQQSLRRIPQVGGHHQRSTDQCRLHAAIQVPTHHAARIQVDHHRQVHPALQGPDIRYV